MTPYDTPLILSGTETLPYIEGGKGISATNGFSAGSWAKEGGVGTFSGVNADYFDQDRRLIRPFYTEKTRQKRHQELIEQAIKGGITQAEIARDVSGGKGRIHMNVLWEMAGAEEVLEGVLSKTKGLIHGITCGAGMPYRLSEIAAKYKVYYYPIISSARAFNALWKRAYRKTSKLLGGVVYEDPWKAGGHNGLSNAEDPEKPESPYGRVKELRSTMSQFGLDHVPIIMAGGVWNLSEWKDWFQNKEIGKIAFQFGTRPLVTKESPISTKWKKLLLSLKKGDILLHKFSPTGFYSSAIKNSFLQELVDRSKRQVHYSTTADDVFSDYIEVGARKRKIYVKPSDKDRIESYISKGYTENLKTPDQTLVFVTPEKAKEIHKDQVDCMGCLSACQFSNWFQKAPFSTGKKADPRSFCIQKTLLNISHDGDVDQELAFAGHNAYRFSEDSFYKDGFIPSVKQLIERIRTGQ